MGDNPVENKKPRRQLWEKQLMRDNPVKNKKTMRQPWKK